MLKIPKKISNVHGQAIMKMFGPCVCACVCVCVNVGGLSSTTAKLWKVLIIGTVNKQCLPILTPKWTLDKKYPM